MIWLMTLGVLIWMSVSVGLASQAAARMFVIWRPSWLSIDAKPSLVRFLLGTGLLAASHPLPGGAEEQAFLFQSLRLRSWRSNLLWTAFSSCGLWMSCLMALSVFRMSGLVVAALGGVLFLIASFVPRLWGMGTLITSWGVFLFLAESGARVASGLMGLGGADLIIWLTDGRPQVVFAILVLVTVLTVILRLRFFFFSVAVLLLSMGWISVSGAVMMWLGERIGWSLIPWAYVRRARQGPRWLLFFSAMTGLAGGFIGFLLVGWARNSLMISPSLGGAGPFEVMSAFVVLSILAEVPILLLRMGWGHFAARSHPDDLLDSTERIWVDPVSLALSEDLLRVAHAGARGRLDRILEIRMEMEADDWNKVPAGVRSASEREVRELEGSLRGVEALLSSSSSGFQVSLR